MRAKYLLNAAGRWKGIDLTPFCEFPVPDHLRDMVERNPNFEVIQPVRRGRKVQDGDAA